MESGRIELPNFQLADPEIEVIGDDTLNIRLRHKDIAEVEVRALTISFPARLPIGQCLPSSPLLCSFRGLLVRGLGLLAALSWRSFLEPLVEDGRFDCGGHPFQAMIDDEIAISEHDTLLVRPLVEGLSSLCPKPKVLRQIEQEAGVVALRLISPLGRCSGLSHGLGPMRALAERSVLTSLVSSNDRDLLLAWIW